MHDVLAVGDEDDIEDDAAAMTEDLGVEPGFYRRIKRVKEGEFRSSDETANSALSRFSESGLVNKDAIRKMEKQISLVSYLGNEPEEKNSVLWWQWKLAIISELPATRLFFMALVIINSVMIGIESGYTDNPEVSHIFETVEFVLVMLFCMEISMKLFGYGLSTFFTDGWNVLDFIIVSASVIEIIVATIYDVDPPSISALRMVRIIRVVRLIGMLERLAVLAAAFMHALEQTFSVMALSLIIVYVFGVFGQQLFHDSAALDAFQEVPVGTCNLTVDYSCYKKEWYATVPSTMLSLFQIMTYDDWAKLTRPVMWTLKGSWVFWTIFVVIGGLGLMNLITAIFIEALLEQTASLQSGKHEKKKRNMLRKLQVCEQAILDFDVNKDGQLSPAELDAVLDMLQKHPDVEAAFEEVGTPVKELQHMISVAEHREDGSIDIMELLNMVQASNMHTIRHSMFELKHRVTKQERQENANIAEVERLMAQLCTKLDQLDATLDVAARG